jgi:hypothetical protein
MDSITITKRSTDQEIKEAISKLQSELDKRENMLIDIDLDIIKEILKRFKNDYWANNHGSIDIDGWLQMNFKFKNRTTSEAVNLAGTYYNESSKNI